MNLTQAQIDALSGITSIINVDNKATIKLSNESNKGFKFRLISATDEEDTKANKEYAHLATKYRKIVVQPIDKEGNILDILIKKVIFRPVYGKIGDKETTEIITGIERKPVWDKVEKFFKNEQIPDESTDLNVGKTMDLHTNQMFRIPTWNADRTKITGWSKRKNGDEVRTDHRLNILLLPGDDEQTEARRIIDQLTTQNAWVGVNATSADKEE
jgi:hypothetical protein